MMDGTRRIWLITNAASGSNSHDTHSRLAGAMASAGMAPDRIIDCFENSFPMRAELESARVDWVICHTGDGTINAVATAIEGWAGAMLVLPGGTTNLLSKAMHGDRPAEEIIARAEAMRGLRRPCIRSAAGTALIEVVTGPGAKWSDVREEIRHGDLAEIASKTVEAARESTIGPMVRLVAPEAGNAEGYSAVRLTPSADGIEIEGYGADGIGDYLKQGVALLKRDFRQGPHDRLGSHREVRCRSPEPMALMVDGERRRGDSEMQFSLAQFDLDLLALAQ